MDILKNISGNKILYITFVLFVSVCITSCDKHKSSIKKAGYSGKDITNMADIKRNKDTKAVTFEIADIDNWQLYSGNSVDNIDFSKPLAEGERGGVFDLDINDTVRYYFSLVTPEGEAVLAERHLPMSGGYNFRDLGGFKNRDGKFVKWGKVFRSDDLYKLTDTDLSYLSSIPLISIVDFRSEEEVNNAPDNIPSSVKEVYSYSISPGNLMNVINPAVSSVEVLDSAMMNMNKMLVSDSACIEQYKKFFDLLQNEKHLPLLFHCSAGKDRTGMGAALFLFSLNVDEETIFNDYLASNFYLGDKYTEYISKYPNLKPLFEVKTVFLKAGIDEIKKEHTTVENYLRNILNVDMEKMQEMYLY